MEITTSVKNNIIDIQRKLMKAIENHKTTALRLKFDPVSELEIKSELLKIQKHIIELNDEQKILLQQFRKDIEENSRNGQLPAYNFNLYKMKPPQMESKKRRRKDTTLTPKVIASVRSQREPSLSPSPTPSSSSSMSDDSFDDVAPSMLPVPVPKARPKLLPDSKENLCFGAVTRRDLRPPKLRLKRKYFKKFVSDDDIYKDIPHYYDPVPSPPPTDEKDLKARFMTALHLIPKEMLHEIQNRKVERKRRSTATNNPNFVYNNDWEIPAWKRSRTYLSPHKSPKIETVVKKGKAEDVVEEKEVKKESESADVKPIIFDNIKLPKGLTVEKVDGKSRNSTPDSSTSANMLCFICKTSGLVSVCKECSTCYHLNCISPGSLICCPNCKNKRSTDDNSSEDSGKEEFATKCPNVAESYNKLKQYIETHADTAYAELIDEREQFKLELKMKNKELYAEKEKLEEVAAELSVKLLVNEESKEKLRKEEQKLLGKIKIITDFVTLFQKTNKKPEPVPEPEPEPEPESDLKSEPEEEKLSPDDKDTPDIPERAESPESTGENSESTKNDPVGSVEPPESFETCDLLDEEKSSTEPLPDEKVKDDVAHVRTESNFENCASPSSSSKESLTNSMNNYDTLFSLSQENTVNESLGNDSNADSPKNDEVSQSPAPSPKENIANGGEEFGRNTPSSRESTTDPSYDLEENEPFLAQMSPNYPDAIQFRSSENPYDIPSDNEYY